jgi:tRNA A37 threonylcarbamoyladenosine biosynthesis protein TsaE
MTYARKNKQQHDMEELTQQMNEAEIPRLDIDNDISDNSVIVLFGRRGSGKSYLGRRLLKRFSDIPKIKIVCPSESVNGDYSKHIPALCIDDDYNPDALAEIFLDQEEIMQEINSLKEAIDDNQEKLDKYISAKNSGRIFEEVANPIIQKLEHKISFAKTELSEIPDPRVIYVADDIMYKSKSPLKDEQLRKVVFNGRHYKVTFMYMSQYPLGLEKNMRGCIDYAFIMAEESENMRQLLYENYAAGIFSNKYLFFKIMDHCTTDRKALVLKMTKTKNEDQTHEIVTSDIERMKGKVFWYKADGVGNFKWKNPILWELHEKYYDPESRKRAREEKRGKLANKGLILPKKKECGVKIKLTLNEEKKEPSVRLLSATTSQKIIREDKYDDYKIKLNKVLNDKK